MASNITDVTLLLEDKKLFEGHRVFLSSDKDNVCKYYIFGYFKLQNNCTQDHVKRKCKEGSDCRMIKHVN